ncbi:MAG: biotin--[acetyl-CoA-carboxylase] ligase [Acidimicrobiales bacterium]
MAINNFFSTLVRLSALSEVCQAREVLVDEAARGRLVGSRFSHVVELAEVTSTNTVLADLARQGAPDGLVVVAGYQSAGRGRLDRRWQAPPGTSLLVSVLLRSSPAELPFSRRHLAVAACALALADACWQVAGTRPELKWPNDLVMGDRKLAGLLAESPAEGALVVGAGLNVSWWPPGLLATCLEQVAGSKVAIGDLLVAYLLALDELYGRWPEVAARYRESCSTIGRAVVVDFGGTRAQLRGKATAVLDDGRLVVDDDASGEVVTVAAGDVVHARYGC